MMRAYLQDSYPIDFVITWVDGADEAWNAEKARYAEAAGRGVDKRDNRYRDWGLLRYLLRSIEAYAPWVDRIFLVTCGHVPDWLNMEMEKLVFVKHEDYIPKRYLPTFNSHPIELNFHRIESLSEHFVNINDDIVFTQPLQPGFFFKDGLPVLCPELHAIVPKGQSGVMPHIYVNNVKLVNRHFEYKQLFSRNKEKWFNPRAIGFGAVVENIFSTKYGEMPGIRPLHLAYPHLKSTIAKVWEAEYEQLDLASSSKFRSAVDVSQQIFWYWQMASGDFFPQSRKRLGRSFNIDKDLVDIVDAVRKQKYPQICANDMGGFEDDLEFECAKAELLAAFESILPNKSSFEL